LTPWFSGLLHGWFCDLLASDDLLADSPREHPTTKNVFLPTVHDPEVNLNLKIPDSAFWLSNTFCLLNASFINAFINAFIKTFTLSIHF
jgi:hypothetical protein